MRTPILSVLLLAWVSAWTGSVMAAPVSTAELGAEIGHRIENVPELRFVREAARELGLRVWLFGGSAAGFAHYVNWDLQRKLGKDRRFDPARFDYDFSNIYRSTQDIDLVVDGPAVRAAELEARLARELPQFQGRKSAWEVRTLREDRGDKQALLHNPDFLNQNTDSNSTGMIELTPPPKGEAIVHDLRDWDSKTPFFLKDVRDGTLHFYESPLHSTTRFYREGRNPMILSVIRYLTKAFQYGLRIPARDEKAVRRIIDGFDPRGPEMSNSYVRYWLLHKNNGRKLFQSALDVEYAWNTLERLGLRRKLIEIADDAHQEGTLAWWMSKEPLRSRPVGEGKGKTAAERGIRELAHSTSDYLALESLTLAPRGEANFFVSRDGVSGERAQQGEGVYTCQGERGACHTGLTVRLELDPRAREGTDFARGELDYIRILNRKAVRVLPESLKMTAEEYLDLFAKERKVDTDDLGLWTKLRRRVSLQISGTDPELTRRVLARIEAEVAKAKPNLQLLEGWFALPVSARYPELLRELLRRGRNDEWVVRHVLTQPFWAAYPDLIQIIVAKGEKNPDLLNPLIQHVLSMDAWKGEVKVVEQLLKRKRPAWMLTSFVLSQPFAKDHPEWVEYILEHRPDLDHEVADDVLSQPHWRHRADWVERVLERGKADGPLIRKVFTRPEWEGRERWIQAVLDRGSEDTSIAISILSRPEWATRPDWASTIIRRGEPQTLHIMSSYALNHEHWTAHPELIEELVRANSDGQAMDDYVFKKKHWKRHPVLLEICGKKKVSFKCLKRAFDDGASVPRRKDQPACQAGYAALNARR